MTGRRPTGHDLSPSSIMLYQRCPAAYRYRYLERATELPPGQPIRTGGLVHRTLARVSEDHGTASVPLATLLQVMEGEAGRADTPVVCGRAADILAKVAPFPLKNLESVEIPFLWDCGYIRVGGIMDRVDRLPDGTILVIDYKCGRAPADLTTNPQALIYMEAARDLHQIRGGIFPKIRIEFWGLAIGEIATMDWTPDLAARTSKMVRDTWQQIQQGQMDATPGAACRGCGYRDRCPDHTDFIKVESAAPRHQLDSMGDMVDERQRLKTLADLADQGRRDLDQLLKDRPEMELSPVDVGPWRVRICHNAHGEFIQITKRK